MMLMGSLFSLREGRLKVLIALLIVSLAPAAARGDTIKLKDGRSLSGIIDQENSDEDQVMIRTTMGTIAVLRSKIRQIEKDANVSYAEASGDLAVGENNLDRAQELYEKAALSDPKNPRLQGKIEEIKKKLDERDRQVYGSSLDNIERGIKEQDYQAAIDEAQAVIARAREDSVKKHCRILMAKAYIGMAQQDRDKVHYPEAEASYRQAIKADPENPVAPLELGDQVVKSTALNSSAIALYRQGITLAQRHPGLIAEDRLLDYHYKLGVLLLNEKQNEEAAETLLEVAQTELKLQTLRYPQAVKYAIDAYTKVQVPSSPEELKHMMANLKALIQLNPPQTTVAQAYRMLGRIDYDQKDWPNARALLAAALKNQPAPYSLEMQEALYQLAISERELGEREQAALALQSLIQQQSTNYNALCELGDIRLEQSLYDDALVQYDKALALDKDKARAYLGKGGALQKKQQYKEARANFKEVIARDEKNVEAQMAIAQTYYSEKSWDDAAAEAKKLLDLLEARGKEAKGAKPSEDKLLAAQALTLMGEANVQLNKTNLARENFDNALKLQTHFAPALEGMGLSYVADNQNEEAIRYLEQAIAAEPKNADFQLNLAIHWHTRQKNPEKALPYYYRYLKLGGKDSKVNDWIKECGGTPPKM